MEPKLSIERATVMVHASVATVTGNNRPRSDTDTMSASGIHDSLQRRDLQFDIGTRVSSAGFRLADMGAIPCMPADTIEKAAKHVAEKAVSRG